MSTDDRALLEAAARAIGRDVLPTGEPWPRDAQGLFYCKHGPRGSGMYSTGTAQHWNPLTDDGDALRLAVKLRIDLVHFSDAVRADFMIGVGQFYDCYERGAEPASTRRAIVRAAAAMAPSAPAQKA